MQVPFLGRFRGGVDMTTFGRPSQYILRNIMHLEQTAQSILFRCTGHDLPHE